MKRICHDDWIYKRLQHWESSVKFEARIFEGSFQKREIWDLFIIVNDQRFAKLDETEVDKLHRETIKKEKKKELLKIDLPWFTVINKILPTKCLDIFRSEVIHHKSLK